jgi:hypothetical protein
MPAPITMVCNLFVETNPLPRPGALVETPAQLLGISPAEADAIVAALSAEGPLGPLTQTVDPATTVQVFNVGNRWAYQDQANILTPYLTENILTLVTSADGTVKGMSSLMRLEYSQGINPWGGLARAQVPRTTPGWNIVNISNPFVDNLLAYGKCIANNSLPRAPGGTPQPLATDMLARIYFSASAPGSFLFQVSQEVLVPTQPGLLVPFWLECDLFVDMNPNPLIVPPTTFGAGQPIVKNAVKTHARQK